MNALSIVFSFVQFLLTTFPDIKDEILKAFSEWSQSKETKQAILDVLPADKHIEIDKMIDDMVNRTWSLHADRQATNTGTSEEESS